MRELSTGDVMEVLGIRRQDFRRWIERGAVKPMDGGGKQGKHQKFTPMQVVGISVAREIWSSDRGCVESYVGEIVSAFGSMSEDELVERFRKGETHFVQIFAGKPLLRGQMYDWPNVEQIFDDVMKNIEKVELRLRNFVGGRPRGLAGANK